MIGFNIAIALGRVAIDAQEKEYASGKKSVNFSIATRNGNYTAPQFINCRAVGACMESAKNICIRGRVVLVRGEFCVNWYKDKYGNNAYNPFIAVQSIECIPSSAIIQEKMFDSFGWEIDGNISENPLAIYDEREPKKFRNCGECESIEKAVLNKAGG